MRDNILVFIGGCMNRNMSITGIRSV